jgi:UDP-N-acetylglucosamine pyrophosphorylase
MTNQIKSKTKGTDADINLKRVFILHMQKEKALQVFEEISSELNAVLAKTKMSNELFTYQGNLYRVKKSQEQLDYTVVKLVNSEEIIQSI